jgi:NDP-sugar pyrophosphorylase family protein
MGELIEAVLNRRTTNGVVIEYAREATPLGTVGPLAMIEALHEEPFLVMNGDVLTDLDYAQLYADHVASGAIATIATTTRQIQVTLGVLECLDESEQDRVTGYVEKPQMAYGASMGVYCFSPPVLQHIEPGVYLDLPELVLRLIERGETVRSWRSDAYWVDLGRREDYELAISEFDKMRSRLIPANTLR